MVRIFRLRSSSDPQSRSNRDWDFSPNLGPWNGPANGALPPHLPPAVLPGASTISFFFILRTEPCVALRLPMFFSLVIILADI